MGALSFFAYSTACQESDAKMQSQLDFAARGEGSCFSHTKVSDLASAEGCSWIRRPASSAM